MNLVELYKQMPVDKHKNIRVVGDRVFVKDSDGSLDEYLLAGGELWLARSDRALKQDLAAIRAKLGIG